MTDSYAGWFDTIVSSLKRAGSISGEQIDGMIEREIDA